jgi:hypothetical protein
MGYFSHISISPKLKIILLALFQTFKLVQSACGLDGGTVSTFTGGYPWLFGGSTYNCKVLDVIDHFTSATIGFSGYCEDTSAN